MAQPKAVTITVDDARAVRTVPHGTRVCYALVHGAGAGMSHPFMIAVARIDRLALSFHIRKYRRRGRTPCPWMPKGVRI